MVNDMAEYFGIVVETWDDIIDALLAGLAYIGATNISSTLSVVDYNGNWLYFNGNSVEFGKNDVNSGGAENYIYFELGFPSSLHLPTFSGQLSFTFDGEPYTIPSGYLIEFLFNDAPEHGLSLFEYNSDYIFEDGVGIWSDSYAKTIWITGGADVRNTDLIAWLQVNATQI